MKKLKIKYACSALITILAFSCTTRESKTDCAIMTELKLKRGDSIRSEQALMSIQDTIVIEDPEDSPLRSITKIIQSGDSLFILDGRADLLYLYDEHGSYLSKIGETGNGKNEYLSIEDFTIDQRTGNIIILTKNSRILAYSADGSFIFTQELCNALIWRIESTDWGFIGSTNHQTHTEGEDACLLYCFDKDFNCTSKQVPVLPTWISAPQMLSSAFQKVANKTFFCDPVQSLIFDVSSPDNIHAAQSIDLPNKMPIEKMQSVMDFIANQLNYNWIMDYFAFDGNIFVSYIFDGAYSVALFNDQGEPLCMGRLNNGALPLLFHGKDGLILSPVSIDDENTDETFGIVRWKFNTTGARNF